MQGCVIYSKTFINVNIILTNALFEIYQIGSFIFAISRLQILGCDATNSHITVFDTFDNFFSQIAATFHKIKIPPDGKMFTLFQSLYQSLDLGLVIPLVGNKNFDWTNRFLTGRLALENINSFSDTQNC